MLPQLLLTNALKLVKSRLWYFTYVTSFAERENKTRKKCTARLNVFSKNGIDKYFNRTRRKVGSV